MSLLSKNQLLLLQNHLKKNSLPHPYIQLTNFFVLLIYPVVFYQVVWIHLLQVSCKSLHRDFLLFTCVNSLCLMPSGQSQRCEIGKGAGEITEQAPLWRWISYYWVLTSLKSYPWSLYLSGNIWLYDRLSLNPTKARFNLFARITGRMLGWLSRPKQELEG